MNPHSSRRRFLKSAAVSVAPFILPAGMLRAADKPSGKIGVGFVGMGKQAQGLMRGFLNDDRVVALAVCDVDTTRRENSKKTVDKHYAKAGTNQPCAAYNDYRELIARDDIDAVCIATPDHWHAITTVAALNAGKDVYCEKPLTHNITEATAVIAATAKNDRVLQTGSMQRSMKEFRVAAELVRNGGIGKLERVSASFGSPGIPCDLPGETAEPGLDWDRWLGPAPSREYNSILSPRGVHKHFPDWRRYREFGGGMVTDWGAHHLDITQWALGTDDSGPVASTPPEGWEPLKNKSGATLTYADGVVVTHESGNGIEFHGTEGRIDVKRGGFSFSRGDETIARFWDKKKERVSLASQVIKAEKEYLKDAKVKLYRSENHVTDFLDCVESRQKPNTNEIIGGRTAICCSLMNLAYYHGEPIKWDPTANQFTGGTGNPDWLTRNYREGYPLS